jgi:hypothetical protein
LLSVIDRSGRIGQTFRISEKASRKSPEEEKRLSPVQIAQMPSGELVPKKSQMASGFLQDNLPKPTVCISQTVSAKFAAAFHLKKWLMEWAEAAEQNKSG